MTFAIVLTEGSIKYKISCDHQPRPRCQVERKAEVLVTVKLPAVTGVTIAAEAECQNTGLGDERRCLVELETKVHPKVRNHGEVSY